MYSVTIARPIGICMIAMCLCLTTATIGTVVSYCYIATYITMYIPYLLVRCPFIAILKQILFRMLHLNACLLNCFI